MLSPYAHELNTSGTDCAADCPACRWVRENRAQCHARADRLQLTTQLLRLETLMLHANVTRVLAGQQPHELTEAETREQIVYLGDVAIELNAEIKSVLSSRARAQETMPETTPATPEPLDEFERRTR